MRKGLELLLIGSLAALAGAPNSEAKEPEKQVTSITKNYKKNPKLSKTQLNELFSALKEKVEAQYILQKGPTPEKAGLYDQKLGEYKLLRKKFQAYDTQNVFMEHGMLFVEWPKTKSTYVGKIDEIKEIEGMEFYITRSEDEKTGFKGIKTLDNALVGNEFAYLFEKEDGKTAAGIDIAPAEESGRILQGDWDFYEKGDFREHPEDYVLYDILKDTPKEEFPEKFADEQANATMYHELRHFKDKKLKLKRKDQEIRAELDALQYSKLPLYHLGVLLSSKPKNDFHKLYKKVAKKIFKGFREYSDVKTEEDVYRLPQEEISKRAKELFNKWYKE
ncbi:hypothetical protein ACFLZZ_03585 [Nanoarchaeota archaeon]